MPEDYKRFIEYLIAIAHEVGHIKKQTTAEGKNTLDIQRYATDLEYRLSVEKEAEEETTCIAKKYGFYSLINDITLK